MATGLASWSQTAASNATADANINWTEGQAPSSVNDSARAMMASLAKWRDDNAGTLTTGGTSTAYTLTTSQVFGSLAAMNGQSLRVKFHTTNGAAPTLAVDGLAAKAIVMVSGTAVGTGAMLTNSIHDLVYDNANNYFTVIGSGYVPLGISSGTKMLFQQTAAPTTWTKDTTHNDKALRLVSGTASTGGGSSFTGIFTARTILQANLPNVNFTVTGTGTLSSNNFMRRVTAGSFPVAGGTNYNVTPFEYTEEVSPSVSSLSASAASGGSGTSLDFAVAYVDCIIATKD